MGKDGGTYVETSGDEDRGCKGIFKCIMTKYDK
jgi:hypothetical protein